MSGLYIRCGSFRGQDKSGSAIEGLLDALNGAPADLIGQLKFEDREHMFISEAQAGIRLPLLIGHRKLLVEQLGHCDCWKAMSAEEAAGMDPVDAKWEKGKGWQLYCTVDLIQACETSLVEHEPILVAYL